MSMQHIPIRMKREDINRTLPILRKVHDQSVINGFNFETCRALGALVVALEMGDQITITPEVKK